MAQRPKQQSSEHDRASAPATPPDEAPSGADDKERQGDGVISSPIEFYESIRNRPDIREILSRLAQS
jgi:hypothetical protein